MDDSADLEAVRVRACRLWTDDVVERWLFGTEPLLGGARPADVVALRGADSVLDALDRIAAGELA